MHGTSSLDLMRLQPRCRILRFISTCSNSLRAMVLKTSSTGRIIPLFFHFPSPDLLHSFVRKMCNPFECFFSSGRERGLVLPPPYRTNIPWDPLTGRYDYTLPDYAVRSLQRCLIWRMAIDWKLQRYIEKYDRPQGPAYANFERNCGLFGCYVLGKRSSDVLEDHLSRTLFGPAESIGIPKSKQSREHFLVKAYQFDVLTHLRSSRALYTFDAASGAVPTQTGCMPSKRDDARSTGSRLQYSDRSHGPSDGLRQEAQG